MNLSSIEQQIELLTDLKNKLESFQININRIPQRYQKTIDFAKEEGIIPDAYRVFNDNILPDTTDAIKKISDSIQENDIILIDKAINKLEYIREKIERRT